MLTLAITGFDDDPDRVSAVLGLTPTAVGRRGEPTRNGRPRAINGWWLGVHEDRLTDGGQHDAALNELLLLLKGKEQQFAKLRATLKPASVSVYGGLYHRAGQQCGVWLEPEQMQVLASCGVGWGLDVFSGEPAEDATA